MLGASVAFCWHPVLSKLPARMSQLTSTAITWLSKTGTGLNFDGHEKTELHLVAD